MISAFKPLRQLTPALLIFCLVAAWKDVPPETLKKIEAQLAQSDENVEGLKLPGSVTLSFTRDEMNEAFTDVEALWRANFDRKTFKDFVDSLADGHLPTPTENDSFRDVRARIKLMRAAFMAFDKSHECPRHIDQLATQLGHISDYFKNNRTDLARKEAGEVSGLLKKQDYEEIKKEIEGFEPSSEKSFNRWVVGSLAEAESNLSKDTVTAHEFHETRKVISHFVDVYNLSNVLAPQASKTVVYQFLTTINGKMGKRHDQLIADKLNGTLDYDRDQRRFLDDFRAPISEFINALKAGL